MSCTGVGWEAVDAIDGDISDAVSAVGLSAVNAAVFSSTPTVADTPLPVRYFVSDTAGNSAEALWLVHVICPEHEQPCTNPEGMAACADGGICALDSAPPDILEPAVVTLVGSDVVLLPQGQPYFSCGPNTPLSIPCDQV